MKGDLHCHTTKSDGSMEPEALVEYAARIKLDYIAVTDHDTMDGVSQALKRAEDLSVNIIPGIEVSTYDYLHKRKVHLLCYFPKEPEPLLALCRETLENRRCATLAMIERVSRKYPLDAETVMRYAQNGTVPYKQHIMMALMQMGFSLSVFGDLYRELFSPKGGWALIDTKLPETRDAFDIIKQTGGAAVLAHPGVYGNFDIIDELCSMGLDGIEVHHPRQSDEDEKKASQAADRYGLLRTGGSDFHGMCATSINPLGTRTAESDSLKALINRFR